VTGAPGSDRFLFRDVFNEQVVHYLAEQVGRSAARQGASFDASAFRRQVLADLGDLSFGDRLDLLITALDAHLIGDYPTRSAVLVGALGLEPVGDDLSGYDGFYVMPLTGFIARHGLDPAHLEISLAALYEMTKRFTAESVAGRRPGTHAGVPHRTDPRPESVRAPPGQ
jgi:hypothetical protein